MSALEGNVLQNSSLRRESAIIESGPVEHGVLLVVVAPLPTFLAVEAGARPDQCSEASCHSSGWKSRQQRSPDTVVVISSDGEGDRSVESLEVKAPVGWETGQIRTGGPAT